MSDPDRPADRISDRSDDRSVGRSSGRSGVPSGGRSDDRLRDRLPERPSIEQQRRRAKELRRALRRGDPDAVARLRHHPRGAALAPDAVKLGDAQLIIARELGFASWPRLVAHVAELTRQVRAIDDGEPAPDGDVDTVHVRCGSDLRDALARAGFRGGFLEFADPYCQGPVRPLPEAEFLAERAEFLTAYGLTREAALDRLRREYAGLAALAGRARAVLWCEHDPYDQLVLARVLHHFHAAPRPAALDLVCVEHYPAVGRFVGLGQLSPAALRSLWRDRVPVDAAMLHFGDRVFRALERPDPTHLHRLASRPPAALAAMGPAIARHLAELPSTTRGLSLTESLIVEVLAGDGGDGPGGADRGMTGAELFRTTQARDPAPFLGDTMFAAVLVRLSGSPEPAVIGDTGPRWDDRRYRLTDLGRQLARGERDWVRVGRRQRWVGGVRIAEGRASWRWDPARRRPVPGQHPRG